MSIEGSSLIGWLEDQGRIPLRFVLIRLKLPGPNFVKCVNANYRKQINGKISTNSKMVALFYGLRIGGTYSNSCYLAIDCTCSSDYRSNAKRVERDSNGYCYSDLRILLSPVKELPWNPGNSNSFANRNWVSIPLDLTQLFSYFFLRQLELG